MPRTSWILGATWICAAGLAYADETATSKGDGKQSPSLVSRTYPVADLAVPLPAAQFPVFNLDEPAKAAPPRFVYLIEHLRRLTGQNTWNGQATIIPFENTLSLVIRQTPEIHEQIADELGRLRRELDVQVTLDLVIVVGSRGELASLVADYVGELGRSEREELLKKVRESATLHPAPNPKMTLFNRATGSLETKGHLVASNVTVSEDRRSIRLKMSHAQDRNPLDLVASGQTLDLRDGRAAAVHFEARRLTPGLPPADDAEELLVIVTPRIIIQEEEEELLGIPTVSARATAQEQEQEVVFTVKPRIIPQEEEEELLGVPADSASDDE